MVLPDGIRCHRSHYSLRRSGRALRIHCLPHLQHSANRCLSTISIIAWLEIDSCGRIDYNVMNAVSMQKIYSLLAIEPTVSAYIVSITRSGSRTSLTSRRQLLRVPA